MLHKPDCSSQTTETERRGDTSLCLVGWQRAKRLLKHPTRTILPVCERNGRIGDDMIVTYDGQM